MRKLKLFLSLLMLFAFSLGNVWAEVSTLTFTAAANGSGTADDGVEWTVTSDGSESNFDSGKGIHYGTSGAAVQYIRLSTSGITETITKVEVNASTASGVSATVGVKVGTTDFKVENSDDITKSLTATATNYTFTGSASGEIVVTVTKPSSAKKAIYCKSIAVTYSTGGNETAVETIELNKDKLTLTVDDEETLTATVSPDNASNKNVTWESSNEDVATVVDGLVTAVGAGDATITCKSVADDTKYATCGVHVNASLYTKSTLNFTAACNGSGTADDGVEWTVTSDGSESSFDNAKGIHYGTGSVAVQYIRLTTSDIEGTIAKVVVNASTASGVSATASVTIGGDAFGGDAQSLSTSAAEYTFTGSASGEIVVLVTKPSSATKAIYVKSIVVYYIPAPQKTPAGLAYDDADLSNLVKLGASFTAPTLANPNSLSVAYTSSNTDVAEVAGDGTLTIKAVGVAEITASSEETDTYKAGSAKYTIYVVAHDGTEADPYTVADARVVIDKVGETGIADKYTKGIVSNVKSLDPSKYQRAQYYISDNGERENEIYVYNGYYLSGADFTSADQLLEGDEVVVKGQILKYSNTTYEVAQDNQLVSLNRSKVAAGLEYAETAIEKNIGDAAFTNALTNPNSLGVTYSSSATGVATVDENGEVTIVGMGTTTIKATFAGNGSYLADEVSYTLTVNDPSLVKVTFDATVDIASDNAEGITKNGVNIKASHVDGVNGSNNAVTYYQCFKNATFTATCTSGNIKRIEFSCTSSNPASGFGESYADGVWTGDAAIVEITATVKQVQMNTVTVYYKVDARAEAGLAYAETAIEKHVGDEAFVNALTNPNNLTVAYESSNTDVAEVANDGNVTIKAEGTATITASFDGDEDYKPASVSYELTVNEPGLDNVTFDATIDYTADASTLTLSKGGFTLTFTNGALNNKENYRLYKDQTMTLSSSDYLIKKIEFTCTNDKPIDGFADATGLNKENSQWTGEANKVELTASNGQVRMTQLVVYYVEDTREASGLAWSTDEVEITLGDPFTAASLVNPNNIDAAEIVIESDNEDLAKVNAGAVELVENVIGEATITATFAGNATYKPAEFSYTITVNDPTPMIITNPTTYLNFGSVSQNALVNAKDLDVTLQNVAAATVSITGDGASAFSATPMTLTESGTIVVSASSDTQGTFSATLTISDDANGAESKEISLSLTVTEPVVEETPVSTTSKWVAAEAADLVDGAEVLITGVKESATYAMGVQNNNNRAAVLASVDGEGILTPGEGTMSFILEEQGDGTFALRTSNGKYLYAAASGSNHLKTQAEVNDDAKWTLTATSAKAESSTNRNVMQFNVGSTTTNPLFSCYGSASQKPIAFYIPYVEPTPEPVYETVRENLEPNRYYTVCLPKKMMEVRGASFWTLSSRNTAETEAYLEEVDPTTAEAGTPFIIQATDTKLEVVYTGAATTTAGTNGALHGTLTYMSAADLAAAGTNIYMLYNNALRPVGTNNHLDANRAYIDYDELNPVTEAPQPAPGRRVRAVPMQQNTATGIDELNGSEAPVKVLINGQLFILRGEKMYDAKGLLVK
ncbi:MAG: Ig-like domain-containing protein [Paludibacteraceae bacterium]|nr:Ig-like domain-containing protein [Paludibacteraceae bacterium]